MTVAQLKENVTTATKSEDEIIAISFWTVEDIKSIAQNDDFDLTQEQCENVLLEVQSMLDENDSFIHSEIRTMLRILYKKSYV